MSGELGKASLDLEANLTPFVRNIAEAHKSSEGMQSSLDALAAISELAKEALNRIKMEPGQAAESKVTAESIISGVHGISEESRTAARELDQVKLDQAQATESKLAAEEISSGLNQVSRNADQAKRKLTEVRLAGGRNGVGFGPFGSGFGRVGLLGTAIGAGVLATPAAGPGAVGLLASIPVLAGAAAGSVGTLALAFDGVSKAIGGDKKAFDDLGPSAQAFVLKIRSLDGWFDSLRQKAAAGLFPGLEKGLTEALSPGTLHEVDVAVEEFSHAIGQAGEQWGRYFGSPEFQHIFGPLMREGARDVGLLSDTALHLADSVGVLARDAIPFTDWMLRSLDEASRLADEWMHAKSASGELAHGLDEAKTSLSLVVHLFGALFDVVVSVGSALYPVSKVAIKDLTDGLHWLSTEIDRNKQTIRDLVSTGLNGLVTTLKIVVGAIDLFTAGLRRIVGEKANVVTAVLLIGAVIAATLGPEAAAITGAILAVGLIEQHWSGILLFFRTLGREIINAFSYAWVEIERGAIIAALKVVEPFSHLPAFLGGWARKAKNSMQAELAQLQPPNMDWRNAASQEGTATGAAWVSAFNATRAVVYQDSKKAPAGYKPGSYGTQPSTRTNPGGFTPLKSMIPAAKTADPLPGTHAWYMKNLGYDPTVPASTPSPWGKVPPWSKNTGATKPPVIPPAASHLEQLASANASRASVLGNVGKVAKGYLDAELNELSQADKLIKAKYESSTGKARTALFAALTSVENRMRSVRKLLGKSITDGRAAQLKFAVDQAKEAVAAAAIGSDAWITAIAAEEKALKAEIAYMDARAKNSHLSLKEREKAIRAETTDENTLKSLLKKSALTATESQKNEAQFIQLYTGIIDAGRSNYQQPTSGKTDTHLHDIKTELKQQTPLLKQAVDRFGNPGTDYALATAGAVAG